MRMRPVIVWICAALFSFDRGEAQEASGPFSLLYSTNPQEAVVQTADTAVNIQGIAVSGNRRTRRSTVLRELPFKAGDTYPFAAIVEKLEVSKRQLMNTNLFRSVVASLQRFSDTEVVVHIAVEEKWYFYPQPFLRLANGSFSQWNERGRPIDDLNFGLKLTQYNFSGRGDKAYVNFTTGYTKKVALQYQGFYFDKALKWSGTLGLGYGKNHEINYVTQNNKLKSIKDTEGYLYEFSQASFDLVYRPAIKTRHQFSIGYNYNRVADTVRKLNRNYVPAGNAYRYLYIGYGVSFTDYNFNPYPTRGRYGDVSLYKAGIGNAINLWQISAHGVRYWAVGSRGYFSLSVAGTLKLPFKQPYIMQGFMGYGDAYLQGYENFIIDGVAGGYSKQTLGLNFVHTQVPIPNIKWLKSLRTIPLKMYAKVFTNEGYSHNPAPGFGDGLANRMLYSTGVGLDVMLFTDVVFKFEWSFNQLGQNGLFLHQ